MYMLSYNSEQSQELLKTCEMLCTVSEPSGYLLRQSFNVKTPLNAENSCTMFTTEFTYASIHESLL